MAKRFLDTIEDAFEEEVLADLIPGARRKAPAAKPKTSTSRRRSGSGRKSFLSALEESKPTAPKAKSSGKGGRKSFLGALEEVFEGMNEKELDSLFPTSKEESKKPIGKQEARITTSIDSQLLATIRKISREHNVPIKAVIQEALKMWVTRKG